MLRERECVDVFDPAAPRLHAGSDWVRVQYGSGSPGNGCKFGEPLRTYNLLTQIVNCQRRFIWHKKLDKVGDSN